MKDPLTLKAPAKINLYLKVVGKREDGYHDILSWMQMVGLYDVLAFRKADSGIDLRVENRSVAADRFNLVVRAAESLAKEAKTSEGASIVLTKNIPVSAGLGGGSSDAAAALVGLNRLWSLGWSRQKLADLGAGLGSDVPFFLQGPAAWVSGRGDRVERAPAAPAGWVVLANPGWPVSTAWVYRQISKKIRLTKNDPEITISRFSGGKPSWKDIIRDPCNDLEKVTLSAYPVLKQMKGKLGRLGGEGAMMSGSGPTLFARFQTEGQAKRAARVIREEGLFQVWVARILRRSPI